MDPDGNGGDFPCPNQDNDANALKATLFQVNRLSLSQVNRLSNSLGGSSYGHNLPRDIPVMLHVSPESARSSFGYIYLAVDERIHQNPSLPSSTMQDGWSMFHHVQTLMSSFGLTSLACTALFSSPTCHHTLSQPVVIIWRITSSLRMQRQPLLAPGLSFKPHLLRDLLHRAQNVKNGTIMPGLFFGDLSHPPNLWHISSGS
jgi:hypothetical protein